MDSMKIGDLVRLRSGGPAMTIVNVNSEHAVGSAKCWWFEQASTGPILREAPFPLPALSVVDPADWSLTQDDNGMSNILERSLKRQQEMAQQKLADARTSQARS